MKASTTAKKVEKFVDCFRASNRFITDRGTSFTSDAFGRFCKLQGIKQTLNSSRHAQASGQVERLNQTILPATQVNLTDEEGRHWDDSVPKIERDLNTAISKTIGLTPFEMLYGYTARFNEGILRELTQRCETYRLPEEIRLEVRDQIEQKKKTYNREI